MARRRAAGEDKRDPVDGSSTTWHGKPDNEELKSQTSAPETNSTLIIEAPTKLSSLISYLGIWLEFLLPDLIINALYAVPLVFGRMTKPANFDPATDVPGLTDKVIFITGGTAGLGRNSVLALAAHNPAEIAFSGRKQASADKILDEAREKYPNVKITFVQCDLTSLESVQKAAHSYLAETQRLDILMCNAGVMATPTGLTKDGYEIQFGTNHLGHALLAKLLLPKLEATPGSRIVILSSVAYLQAPKSGFDFKTLKSTQSALGGFNFPPVTVWTRYGQSKLANLLYAKALAKHHPGVTSVAVHPGIIKTGLFQGVSTAAKPAALAIGAFANTTPVEQGHYNQLWAATCPPDQLDNGAYYEPVGVKTTPKSKAGRDDELVEELWTWTQEALKEYN